MASAKSGGTKRKTKTASARSTGVKAGRKKKAAIAPEDSGGAVVLDRRSTQDRRGVDRREKSIPVAIERRQVERREKVSRRRQIDPTTCERDYSPEEIEFMSALDDYKRTSGRMFPTCSEILEVIKGLGYQKRCDVEPESEAAGELASEADAEKESAPESGQPAEVQETAV